MAQAEREHIESTQIVFGKGGMIANNPQNAALLQQVMATPPLSPKNMLKLVTFFYSYPTNRPFAEHLALYAAAKIITDSNLQQDDDDPWGDMWGYGDETEDEPPLFPSLLSIKSVRSNGFNFLVETREGAVKGTLEHFIVGISPDPATLPAD
jgi:hypothetical protein